MKIEKYTRGREFTVPCMGVGWGHSEARRTLRTYGRLCLEPKVARQGSGLATERKAVMAEAHAEQPW